MNIVLSLNSKYIKPTVVCMYSVIQNNNCPINFYILHSDLNDSELKIFEQKLRKSNTEINFYFIKINSNKFAEYPTLGRSKEAYFRLIIPDVLPNNLERCLYLDGDTLVQGDLQDFYNTNFEDKALVVCEDIGEILLFHKKRHGLLNIPAEYKYFNSGVLLFNLKYFREKVKYEHLFKYIEENSDKLLYLDQDVLNANFYDKVKFSDNSFYNYMEILVNPILINDNLNSVRIIHYIQKPWKYSYTGKNSKAWWSYGKKIYKKDFNKFIILNNIYRKILSLVLLLIPLSLLKKIKNHG